MFKVLLMLLIPALASGNERCKTTIVLRIDDKFTKEQQEDIREATRTWYKASKRRICFLIGEIPIPKSEALTWRNDGCFTIYSGEYRWQKRVARKQGCVYKGKLPCVAITIMGKPDGIGGDIFIVRSNKFRALMLHEIGHIMGLPHSMNKKDVMYKIIKNDCLVPTRNDIKVVECLLNNNKVAVWNNDCLYEKE